MLEAGGPRVRATKVGMTKSKCWKRPASLTIGAAVHLAEASSAVTERTAAGNDNARRAVIGSKNEILLNC